LAIVSFNGNTDGINRKKTNIQNDGLEIPETGNMKRPGPKLAISFEPLSQPAMESEREGW
jgi:hypothetical protein